MISFLVYQNWCVSMTGRQGIRVFDFFSLHKSKQFTKILNHIVGLYFLAKYFIAFFFLYNLSDYLLTNDKLFSWFQVFSDFITEPLFLVGILFGVRVRVLAFWESCWFTFLDKLKNNTHMACHLTQLILTVLIVHLVIYCGFCFSFRREREGHRKL